MSDVAPAPIAMRPAGYNYGYTYVMTSGVGFPWGRPAAAAGLSLPDVIEEEYCVQCILYDREPIIVRAATELTPWQQVRPQ